MRRAVELYDTGSDLRGVFAMVSVTINSNGCFESLSWLMS